MIIRRVHLNKDQKDGTDKSKRGQLKRPMPSPKDDGPRSERRRGDRRRGYRRIDDRNLISRAHEEANAIREMAAREGFEYGLEKAKEQIQELSNVLTQLLDAKEQAMRLAINDIAQMAVEISEKLVKQEVAADPEIVLNITSHAIKEMGKNHSNIIIKVNPADSALIKEHLPELYPYGDSKTTITVIEDNEVDWGSCIVETNTGVIDARFSTQLAILQRAFEIGI